MKPKTKYKTPLPIDSHIQFLLTQLNTHCRLIVVAPPGTGKSTRIPPEVSKLLEGKTLLLQPRRVAVKSTCLRIAEEQEWTVGDNHIGYQMRLDSQVSNDTRLIVMTEGVLSQLIISNPQLSGIDCVILDEFHERSLHSDFAISWIKYLQDTTRPELKVIIVSATLATEELVNYLPGCCTIECDSPLYSLEKRHGSMSFNLHSSIELQQRILGLISEALSCTKYTGDILVFLPGIRDVEELISKIKDTWHSQLTALPLHSKVPIDEQLLALKKGEKRKIVCATNIAETSLTVDGVQIVIDSGLEKVSSFNPTSGVASLNLQRISKASAIQRAGRACRQQPGLCLQAWTVADEQLMKGFLDPEILRSELTQFVFYLASLSSEKALTWDWLTPPKKESIDHALLALSCLGVVKSDSSIELTPLGKTVALFPGPVRWARHLYQGFIQNDLETASTVLAILEEGSFLKFDITTTDHFYKSKCDIGLLVDIYNDSKHFSKSEVSITKLQKIRKSSMLLAKHAMETFSTLQDHPIGPITLSEENLASFYVACSHLDQLARRRPQHKHKARRLGGRGLSLSKNSCVKKCDLFIALDPIDIGSLNSAESSVRTLVPIEKQWVQYLLPHLAKEMEWVEEAKTNKKEVVAPKAFKALMLYDTPLEVPRPIPADPEVIAQFHKRTFVQNWDSQTKDMPRVRNWLARLSWAQQLFADMEWPSTSEELLLDVLDFVYDQEPRPKNWNEALLLECLELLLRQEQIDFLDQMLPEVIFHPVEKIKFKVIYFGDRTPKIQCRIQDFFGINEQPMMPARSTPLWIEFLRPNNKPIETTKDLSRFWISSYPAVRKELKARYPKHHWPEDPLRPND